MGATAGLSFVTGVHPDSRAPGYLIVEVDGARFASLPAEVVSAIGAGAGVRLNAELQDALNEAADVEAAYQIGLRALRARPRSRFETRTRLAERGHRGPAAQRAIDRLIDQGYLDDRAYAEHFTEARLARGHGRVRILSDLAKRGVARDVAEAVVSERLADVGFDESQEIEAVIDKRLPQLGHLDATTQKRRLLGYLQRRGYGGSDVFRLVDEKIAEAMAD